MRRGATPSSRARAPQNAPQNARALHHALLAQAPAARGLASSAPAAQQQQDPQQQQQPEPPGHATQSAPVGGRRIVWEAGRLAPLAHGAALARYGGTVVLSTAVADPNPVADADGAQLQARGARARALALRCIPLCPLGALARTRRGCALNRHTHPCALPRRSLAHAYPPSPARQVEFRDRAYAYGRVPHRADRREPATTERETLAARAVDRALRPLMPPGLLCTVQVTNTVLSADGGVDPEVLAINAASAALLRAGLPWGGPVGCAPTARVRALACRRPPALRRRARAAPDASLQPPRATPTPPLPMLMPAAPSRWASWMGSSSPTPRRRRPR